MFKLKFLLVLLLVFVGSMVTFAQEDQGEGAELDVQKQAGIGLAAMALRESDNANHDRAVLLALEALEEYPYTPQAESALADIIEAYIPFTEITISEVRSYAWSPDGSRIALGGSAGFEGGGTLNDGIRITPSDDITSDAILVSFSLESSGCVPRKMVWSPDGSRLVSIYMRGEYSNDACQLPPTVWDTVSGEKLVQFTGHDTNTDVLGVDWSPDGKTILTTGTDNTIKIWDAEDGTEILTIPDHTAPVTDAVWSPDCNQFATISLDRTMRVWDAASGDEQLSVSSTTSDFTGIDWSPDGQHILVATSEGVGRIFEAQTGELLLNLIGHDGALVDAGYSPTGDRIATASNVDGTARIWDAESGEMRLEFPSLGVEVMSVSWSPDGNQFTVNGPRHYMIWDVSSQPLRLIGHTARIQDGEWSPDGSMIATVSFDGTARIWDAQTGEALHVLQHDNQVWHLDWSPDSTRIVTACGDGYARIWNAQSGELVREVELAPDAILFSARWSPDGSRIINGDLTSRNTVWNPETGEIIATLDHEAAHQLLGPDGFCILFGPSWSPDSSRIAIGCPTGGEKPGTGVTIWDPDTGELLQAFEPLYNGSSRTDWSPDGTRIANATGTAAKSTGILTVWDANTGELVQTFAGHSTYSYGLRWSPDGSRIASGDLDGLVKVWDPLTSEEVLGFRVPGLIINVHWHPDGTYIIANGDFTSPVIRRVWSSTQALIDHAYDCCVNRELTPEERQQFGLPSHDG